MTRAQASYLAALSERAGMPVDEGLTVAEASERIETLAGGRREPLLGERHRSSRTARTGREPMTGAQAAMLLRLSERAGVAFEGSLTSAEAAERIASLVGAPDREHIPAQRVTTSQRIPTREQIPTADYIPSGAEIRSHEEDLARRRLEREERVLTGAEIRASEEARKSPIGRESQAKEQEASRQADREVEHGRRLERIRRRWW